MVTTEAAAGLLKAQGLRMTPQRLAILREVMATSGYVMPAALTERVQAGLPGVSAVTVYRTLERLERLGILTHVHLDAGVGYHRVEEPLHAHLTCVRCATQVELPPGTLQDLERYVEREHGFRADFTHHAISGLCGPCRAPALADR
jgi:Fur family ferric uptake transcriptional regulator